MDETKILALVAELTTSLAVSTAAGGIRAYFAQRADVVNRAIQATSSRFGEIEGTETALLRWTSTEAFAGLFESVHAGDHDSDEGVVASFIDEGGVPSSDKGECWKLAGDIVVAFIGELYGALLRSDDGLTTLANRQEGLHLETRDEIKRHIDARFAELIATQPLLHAAEVVPPRGIKDGDRYQSDASRARGKSRPRT